MQGHHLHHTRAPQHQPLGRKAEQESSRTSMPIPVQSNNKSAKGNKFVFDEVDDDDSSFGLPKARSNKQSMTNRSGKSLQQQPNGPAHHGRPRIPSKQDVLDYTFGVPDSPQHRDMSMLAAANGGHNPFSPSHSSLQSRSSSMESISTSFTEMTTGMGSAEMKSKRDRQPHHRATPSPQFDTELLHEVCEDSLRPWNYLLTIPGKNVRDMLIQAFHLWIPSCHETHLVLIKQIIAYLHSASLVVDDIEDESLTRRGFPCAHIKFGLAPSLNAANYVYFLAMEKVLLLQSPQALECFTNEMLNLHRGQGRDIFWRTSSYIASEREYLEMVQDKTGGLFRLAIRLMTSVASRADSHVQSSLIELCNDLASFFQIRDDLINLASPEFHKKKGFCEDITEGKFSFIALDCFRKLKKQRKQQQYDELMVLLQSKTTDREEIKRALQIMESTGSFAYCLRYLDDLQVRISHLIDVQLGGNAKLSAVMKQLSADLNDCHDIQRVLSS